MFCLLIVMITRSFILFTEEILYNINAKISLVNVKWRASAENNIYARAVAFSNKVLQ